MEIHSDIMHISPVLRGVDKELREHALIADVELVLEYDRGLQPTGGFYDFLQLRKSDSIKNDPFRRCALQDVHLAFAGFQPEIATISYLPAHKASFQRNFYKRTESGVFVTDLDEVVLAGRRLLSKIESIVETPFAMDVSVDCLDYFLPAKKNGLAMVEFTPYLHTDYEDTQGFADWIRKNETH